MVSKFLMLYSELLHLLSLTLQRGHRGPIGREGPVVRFMNFILLVGFMIYAIMYQSLQGEPGPSGIPGYDGRPGDPVSFPNL